ncbi:hypothetical protein BH10PLA1_BH10PLA1_14620 [soil metagenome]
MSNTSIDSIRRAAVFGAGVLALAVLYWGRELLIPLALATLLAFLLKPVVNRLVKWHFPKTIAVLIATGLTAAAIVGMILLLSSQVVDLTAKLPNYQHNLTEKMRSIQGSVQQSVARISGTIEKIKTESATTKNALPMITVTPDKTAAATADATNSWDFMSIASAIVNPILTPITQTGVVFILVFFLLLDSEVVGRRMHWVSEHWRLGIPLDAIDEAFTRVGGYLRTQLLVNAGYGAVIAGVMALIGVPNAILWGVLSAVLRYVPFVGPWIAASLPIALSIAIFPGWSHAWLVVSCFVLAEALTYGLIEPVAFGHSTGVSTIGVVIATFFWGWLWGPVGLILAMPLTACMVVIGRHIPLLRTLSVLLSSDSMEPTEASSPTNPTKPFEVTSYILKMR